MTLSDVYVWVTVTLCTTMLSNVDVTVYDFRVLTPGNVVVRKEGVGGRRGNGKCSVEEQVEGIGGRKGRADGRRDKSGGERKEGKK